jgi:hypothetical protein
MFRRSTRRRPRHHSALLAGVLLTACGFGTACGSHSSSPPRLYWRPVFCAGQLRSRPAVVSSNCFDSAGRNYGGLR